MSPPVCLVSLPEIGSRIDTTPQLALCIGLLTKNGYFFDPQEDPSQILSSDTADQLAWLDAMKQDSVEQERLRWLGSRMVDEFANDASKDSIKIAEMVLVGPMLDNEHYRRLLSCIITAIDQAVDLDVVLLQGLVQLVHFAPPEALLSDDLVKILRILRVRLQDTHQQSSVHLFHLTLAVSRLLDAMADHKVKNLDRVEEHEPLSGVLSGLKASSDPYMLYQACYAFQALQYVPNNESPLQAVLRHSTGVVDGPAKVSAVIKLDLRAVLEGLDKLQEALNSVAEVAGTAYNGACSLMESGRGVLHSLKEGFESGQKRPWYTAIRAAYALVQTGQLKDLNVLIYEAPCRRNPLFQWGICQLLGEIASENIWETNVRLQAIALLGELYRNDPLWGQDESIRTWMLNIIRQLCASTHQSVSDDASALIKDLNQDQDTTIRLPYPLRNHFPLPASSPTLAHIQNVSLLEYDLCRHKIIRLEQTQLSRYIPLLAKASLRAKDEDTFPLLEKVLEFLANDRHVMLILGNSGSGKSTFNRHLEHRLWTDYKQGGSIPLFINLPIIDHPDQDLITKQLRAYNFSNDQILEMKMDRQLILICDGYDESQLTVNLNTANFFNGSGQWSVKMAISCRTQFLGQDYHSRFIPYYTRQATDLFQEAVIAPFSKEQIEDYIEQYVHLEPRTWTTKDYMDKLTTIPNLMNFVKDPFLLSLSLEALPGVIEGKQDLSTIKITRVQLYDTFVRHWLAFNSRRLQRNTALNREDQDMLDQLLEAGFISKGIDYATRLASAIFEHQDGNPVVEYVHLGKMETWKTEFFGPDPKTRMLQESSPLIRTGSLYRFVHRSMLEYFLSCAVFDPSSHNDHDEFAPKSNVGSTGPALLDAEGPLFKRNLLTEPSVIQFLCERVKQHPAFKKQLLAVIEQSKIDASAATAASNAITILVRAGVFFNSADLRGIRIPGADLSDDQFDSAQVQGADLRGVNFARSWLRQVDFGDAQMDGVRFGELPYLEEQASVEAIAFSPNGNMFAACLSNGGLVTYDTTTWTRVHQHKEQSKVLTLAFSPNNRHLAIGNRDTTCRLWDTVSGETLLVMEGHTGGVDSVAFSPCGKQIASASVDRTIRLWNSEIGECLFVLNGHGATVLSARYLAGGWKLVSGSNDGTIRVWDSGTGTPMAEWVIPHVGASRVAISADGREFAVMAGSRSSEIHLVDAITGETSLILNGDDAGWLSDIAFSPITELIVSSSEDKTVRLWDSSSGQLISRFSGHGSWITACAFSPDGLQIASGDVGGVIRLWEVNTNRSSSNTIELATAVRIVAYSHDGLSIISVRTDDTIQRWNSSAGASRSIELSSTFDVNSVALSPKGHWFASGCEDGNIRPLNTRTDVVERVLFGSSHYPIVGMSFSPCGRWLVSCDGVWVTRLWDLDGTNDQGKEVGERVDLYLPIGSVVFSPVGDRIAVGSLSSPPRLLLFDPRVTGFRQPLKEVCLSDKLHSMDYSPDGQQLVLGTESSSVLLWDLQSDEPDVRLEGHIDAVYSVAYSPCGKWILSGSGDRTARLWSGEVDSWSCVAVVSGYSEAVTSVAWNPVVPMEFVTGSDDGSVRVWRILGTEARGMSVHMQWGSHIGQLCAADLTVKGAVGLSPIHRKLLVQRGAIDDSLLPEGDEPE